MCIRSNPEGDRRLRLFSLPSGRFRRGETLCNTKINLLKAPPHNSAARLAMSFPPSASCKFLDLPPVNLRNLHLHLTKNPFASRPPHLRGVTLKTGVQKHGKDEVVLNKSYQELAEHYGTAILPARVRAPKDKAAVEGTVGIISTFILAALRNRQFLSLLELNEAIWDRLEAFNHKPFQKREGSRASSFAEERPFLRPLPPRPFELAIWKVATVGPNYHISVERMNYSVPFEYIKQKVDVRLTRSTVEVFYGGNRICSHPRLYGRFNQYSTIQAHMPPEHQKYVQWNGERFIHWAGKVGSNTQVVVRAILGSYKVEQQGYKSCMGLLKLADKYTPERLENACKRALEYTPRPSLKNIQAILASGQDKAIPEQSTATASSSQYGFTRGADYYGRGNK